MKKTGYERRYLTPEELRKVQLTELEILEEIDRICKKNRIRYCVIAGTLLGSVRHKGFIPWDDDADVAMLRPEYDRFVEACRKDTDHSRFYFQDHRTEKGYRWGYGKMRRKGTLFLRQFQEQMPYKQGIFVDVFPLDSVPDSQAGRTIMNARCFLLRKCLWARVGRSADRSPLKRVLYGWIDLIPERFLLSLLDGLIRERRRKKTKWVRILMFPTPNRKYGYLRRWYRDLSDTVFEGRSFPGIREYDAYLSFKYGDYRKLPAEADRKTHPVTALRLLPEKQDAEDE